MHKLPLLIDADEAISFYKDQTSLSSCVSAYVVGILANEGWPNSKIRSSLDIEKVYTVTHLKRVGTALSILEFDLWYANQNRITLGHLRAIAKMPGAKREALMRDLLVKRISVHDFEDLAKGKKLEQSVDVKRFERLMSEKIGRDLNLIFDTKKHNGSITLHFSNLGDLDTITSALGFNLMDDF